MKPAGGEQEGDGLGDVGSRANLAEGTQARHLLADVGMRRSCASCQSVEMDPSATALVRIPFGVIANSAGALIGAGVVYVLTRPDTQQLQELDYAKVEP